MESDLDTTRCAYCKQPVEGPSQRLLGKPACWACVDKPGRYAGALSVASLSRLMAFAIIPIGLLAASFTGGEVGGFLGFLLGLTVGAGACIVHLLLRSVAESMLVLVDIEANTRLAARVSERAV